MQNSDCERMQRFIDENYPYEFILWTLAFDNEDTTDLE